MKNLPARDVIQSIQFKDQYMVIETLGTTYTVKKTYIGEWDSLQALLLEISERRDKKYFDWDSDRIDRTIR